MYKLICFMLVLTAAYGRYDFGLEDIIEKIVEDVMEQNDDFSCQGKADGDYKHPTDCYKFIKCAHGIVYAHDCPGGLRWDDVAKNCLNVPCHTGGGGTTTTTVTTVTRTCTDNAGKKHALGSSWIQSSCVGCPGYDTRCTRCTCNFFDGKARSACGRACPYYHHPCGALPYTLQLEKVASAPANCFCEKRFCANYPPYSSS